MGTNGSCGRRVRRKPRAGDGCIWEKVRGSTPAEAAYTRDVGRVKIGEFEKGGTRRGGRTPLRIATGLVRDCSPKKSHIGVQKELKGNE